MTKEEDHKVNIFSGRTLDGWNNACLNFTHGKNTWLGYSTGYKRGAAILSGFVCNQQEYQDTLIFPILFLYRHYIELMLKQILSNCAVLLEKQIKFKHHNLQEYWELAKVNIEQCSEDPLPKEFIISIDSIVAQLNGVDSASDAFRYPSRKNGTPTLPGIKYINIKQLSEEMDKISGILEGIEMTLNSIIDYKNEYLSSLEVGHD
jgi:hypothetical protein